MKRLLLFLFVFIFLIQACSPEPVYRLKSEADQNKKSYYQGVEYVYLEKDSVFVTVSYFEHTGDMFALEIEVANKSDRIIRVTPDSIAYKAYLGKNPNNLSKFLTKKWAKDPEQEILNLDLALSQQKANQKTDEFLFYTLQGINVASGLMADTEEEKQEASNNLEINAANQQNDREEYRYRRSSLRDSKKFWKSDALRISDLWPRESVSGLIYFDTEPDAQLYHMLIKVEELQFDTWFRQHKFGL